MSEATSIAMIILAAGASRRLGRPKQLLVHDDRTLLRHAVDTALGADCGPVVVVLGDKADELRVAIADISATIIENASRAEGMSSSIRRGVSEVQARFPACNAVLFMVCDQPHVSIGLLRRIVELHRGGRPIVACRYADTVGVPALFDRRFFPGLLALAGDRGAKGIVQANLDMAGLVPFPGGEIDVDLPGDVAEGR